jgi:antitoxin CptB
MSTQNQSIQSALRWQCRRGMLELDLLLNEFLDDSYPLLSDEYKNQFDVLLDYPDQTLFDLLMGKMQSSDNRINNLIQKININLAVKKN